MRRCGVVLLKGFHCRGHRTAALVPQNHHQRGVIHDGAVFDTALDEGVVILRPGAHYEEIAKALVKDDLWWNPRINAAEHDCHRVLVPGQLCTPARRLMRVCHLPARETGVTCLQGLQRIRVSG